MTFHHAPSGITADAPFAGQEGRLDALTNAAAGERTWADPAPFEQVEFLAQNFLRGNWVIVPILDQSGCRVRSIDVRTWVTPTQLQMLRDGDAVLATKLTESLDPVHSVGSVTVHDTCDGLVREREESPVLRYLVEPTTACRDGFDTYGEAFNHAVIMSEFSAKTHTVRAELRVGRTPTLAVARSSVIGVTIQLAVVDYDDDTRILGYEVVEGTVGA